MTRMILRSFGDNSGATGKGAAENMRYQLSEADALFVEEVQCFLRDNLDPHLARR